MNIKDLHKSEKEVSTASLFKTKDASAIAIQILADGQLKEHVTKVPALLICITGEVIFENEHHVKENLTTGDYVNIEANVKHWINAKSTSNLLLIK
jgi:quercetin dioxygenase-like cupin family protein